jgi:proliferating cell nuclear antigen PCNA
MTIIFKARTEEAYRIKLLSELLANNIKTGCFVINEKGIFYRMMDSQRLILIDVELFGENFQVYKFNLPHNLYVGLNLSHFFRMCKSIKKKEKLELFIDDKSPNELGINVIPKENDRSATSYITIQNVQNLDIKIPEGYKKPIIVNSSAFQKMIKDMGMLGSTVNITAKNYKLEFNCNAGGILKKKFCFNDDGSDDEDNNHDISNIVDENKVTYSQDFLTEQLNKITKLSGLSNNIQIFTGKPLLLKSNIGEIGKISIFIKSKEQIETDNKVVYESDYDSD